MDKILEEHSTWEKNKDKKKFFFLNTDSRLNDCKLKLDQYFKDYKMDDDVKSGLLNIQKCVDDKIRNYQKQEKEDLTNANKSNS